MCKEEKGLLISSIASIILISAVFCIAHQLFLNQPESAALNSMQYKFIAAVQAAKVAWIATWILAIILAFFSITTLPAFITNLATLIAAIIFAKFANVDEYAATAILVALIAIIIACKNVKLPENKKSDYIALDFILTGGIIAIKVFGFKIFF